MDANLALSLCVESAQLTPPAALLALPTPASSVPPTPNKGASATTGSTNLATCASPALLDAPPAPSQLSALPASPTATPDSTPPSTAPASTGPTRPTLPCAPHAPRSA